MPTTPPLLHVVFIPLADPVSLHGFPERQKNYQIDSGLSFGDFRNVFVDSKSLGVSPCYLLFYSDLILAHHTVDGKDHPILYLYQELLATLL